MEAVQNDTFQNITDKNPPVFIWGSLDINTMV